MPEVAICTETIVITACGTGIFYNHGTLEYLPEYFIQYLSVCLPLLIQPVLEHIVVLDSNRQDSNHYDVVY
jgi:uncharacterized circularly permuted ATP-grasp superfamily protein